jgi:hypothetical protein
VPGAWTRKKQPRTSARTNIAAAQTKITVGKFIGGSSLHIPSYVALARGYFKEKGLDAHFVTLAGRPLITAGVSGQVDVGPMPSGGAQAALHLPLIPQRRSKYASSVAMRPWQEEALSENENRQRVGSERPSGRVEASRVGCCCFGLDCNTGVEHRHNGGSGSRRRRRPRSPANLAPP